MVASSCQLPMRSASVCGYELLALFATSTKASQNLHLGVEIACARGNCTSQCVCQPGSPSRHLVA